MPKSDKRTNPLENIRHSLAHLLAMAVLKKFPRAKLGIGPVIENGFYYDFKLPRPITDADLPALTKTMRELIVQNLGVKGETISPRKAKALFKDQPFKLELIKEFTRGKQNLTVYRTGTFTDLCRGGHVKNTREINPDAFKLTHLAGAYWRGSERNPMLTRVYGAAFATKEELAGWIAQQEEAKRRDHRKLGRELDLFSFHEEAPGFVFWHPKGMVLREALMKDYAEMHKQARYESVSTPILLSEKLWRTSGHWENFKEKMYFTKIDKRTFAIKPMNCPGVILIYKERPHSWRDFPLRLAETGEVHRHELSGTLLGLLRVRAFRQDDAHIFVREDQIEEELRGIINLTLGFYKLLGFSSVAVELSTRPEKAIGSIPTWSKAENTLKKILKGLGLQFTINEGEGAFYGPKIDFHIKDALSRSWQCGTIQLDFSMPERFELTYIDKDGLPKRPVMIHRTVIGSIQRFVGILIEHYAGAFPTWLAPVQVVVLPVSERHQRYAKETQRQLQEVGIRVEIMTADDTLGKRIREAELQKIPYVLVVGDKEISKKAVNVRVRGKGNVGMQNIETFRNKIVENIRARSNTL